MPADQHRDAVGERPGEGRRPGQQEQAATALAVLASDRPEQAPAIGGGQPRKRLGQHHAVGLAHEHAGERCSRALGLGQRRGAPFAVRTGEANAVEHTLNGGIVVSRQRLGDEIGDEAAIVEHRRRIFGQHAEATAPFAGRADGARERDRSRSLLAQAHQQIEDRGRVGVDHERERFAGVPGEVNVVEAGRRHASQLESRTVCADHHVALRLTGGVVSRPGCQGASTHALR